MNPLCPTLPRKSEKFIARPGIGLRRLENFIVTFLRAESVTRAVRVEARIARASEKSDEATNEEEPDDSDARNNPTAIIGKKRTKRPFDGPFVAMIALANMYVFGHLQESDRTRKNAQECARISKNAQDSARFGEIREIRGDTGRFAGDGGLIGRFDPQKRRGVQK